jgi:hypothetical protein
LAGSEPDPVEPLEDEDGVGVGDDELAVLSDFSSFDGGLSLFE